ncbi:MAG: NAD(P)-dependent oxidoreductase [Candidatus Electrothrix sp. GM3_4]|nr:NAD(P)-dependent oxidoreductase [Candidatus Electrothrix sp. GM3_4]
MKPAERMAIPRQNPQELDPAERIKNFKEVTAGYDEETAILEAQRCLQCKKPACIDGCPIRNDIPGFIILLRDKKFEEAYWKVRETSTMPSVCSRVCPHEFQCEGSCIRGKKGEPVAIGMLERYLTDWMVANKKAMTKDCAIPNGRKVAIIGSGPAGITAAYVLAHQGYKCTIYEALPVFGGMLSVGIPHYRLPRDIIGAELAALKSCGVEIKLGMTIGKDKTLQELREDGYDSVFIGIGAHEGRKLGIEGEETTKGVLHGVDYLRRVLTGEIVDIGKKVVVVGGGNVAIDVARTALRTGSDEVFILYRRTKEEMPASGSEIHHLEEEGVRVEILAAPVKILADEKNQLTGVECIRMELGEPDESGRRRPVVQEGSNFIIEADSIIPAISQNVQHEADNGTDIKLESWGTYTVNPRTLQTSVPWIFAGGDNVLGPQTAAKAVYQGKVAAESMQRFMEGKDLEEGRDLSCYMVNW